MESPVLVHILVHANLLKAVGAECCRFQTTKANHKNPPLRSVISVHSSDQRERVVKRRGLNHEGHEEYEGWLWECGRARGWRGWRKILDGLQDLRERLGEGRVVSRREEKRFEPPAPFGRWSTEVTEKRGNIFYSGPRLESRLDVVGSSGKGSVL